MYESWNPAHVAALKSELLTDPTARGYAAPLAAGDHQDVAHRLNATYAAAGNIQLGEVPCYLVRAAVSLADWRLLTAEERAYLHMLLDGETVNLSSGMVDNNLVQAGGIWAPGSGAGSAQQRGLDSRGRLMTLKQRKATRAEELFGLDTTIQHADVSAALQAP